MTFEEVVDQAVAMLQRRGRVAYRALKRQFELDDDYLDDLKATICYEYPQVVDDGQGLVWPGEIGTMPETRTTPASAAASAPQDQGREPVAYTPQHLTEKILISRSALEGERKQVTVMFADIKDSTELIRDLDPEAAQQLLDPVIHIMMDAVHRFEGTVNQVLGDGIMAIFGAPIAHEDHAARACYAALAMQAAMQPHADAVLRSHGIAMRIRVGMNAGEVVVRTIGNDLHMDYSAVGPTTHLAARMEQIAAPGSIMLSGATLRLVEGFVRVNALGAVPVKGMPEPVEVYELTGASTVRRRLQAAVARGLTRFVGRDTEIESLYQALEQAGNGHGQIVAAVGEAGMGKSRLFYEFIHSHRTQGWLVLESASVSYGKATPYFPVIDLLKRYVQVEDDDELRTIRARVTGQILTLDETLQEIIAPLLSLLDALPDDSPFRQLDPSPRRQRTLDGLKRLLLRESQVQPLLLVFEDLHWIDAETQALLDSLIESLPTARLLLLVNYRPEYQHGWGSKTYYTQLRLDPLPAASADAFLDVLLGDEPSLQALKMLLIERTGGNPFFLEESVRTLVETQALSGESGAYRLLRDVSTIHVPVTVQAILAARIDRLPQDEKRLLQTAAVIGADVPLPLLQAIAELPETSLQHGLTHLQAAEFLYETSLFPERQYTFKHALTHEVAYGSLLQGQRRDLHARIVKTIETHSGERLSDHIERLAHHALRGEVWDKAVYYYRQSGAKAMQQSAYREAVLCYEQALAALDHLPTTRETQEQGIDLRIGLRDALSPLGGQERILDLLQAAESLAEALGDPYRRGLIARHLSTYFQIAGEYDRAVTCAQHALALGRTHGSVDIQAWTNVNLGRIYYSMGDYHQALEIMRQTMVLIEGEQIAAFFGPGTVPSVYVRIISAHCHTELGSFAEGMAVGAEAMRMAESVENPFSLIVAYASVGGLCFYQGNVDEAIAILERGLALCNATRNLFHFPWVASRLAVPYVLVGRGTEALALVKQAMERVDAESRVVHVARVVTGLSEALLLAGCPQEAGALAERASALSQARRERGVQAHVQRLLGDIAMHREPLAVNQAGSHYRQSLALAVELGMRPLQAHCHRTLGILYGQTGQPEQARAELSMAIELYRDMEMTSWLPETEAWQASVS